MADETKIDVNGKADIRNGEPIGQVIENRDDSGNREEEEGPEFWSHDEYEHNDEYDEEEGAD